MDQDEPVDVAIVGGGMAGSLAALALAGAGRRIVLFDVQPNPQPEFRAEQIVGPLVDRLASLGALPSIVGDRPFEPVTLDTRLGQVLGGVPVQQVGIPYHEMVAGARAATPGTVTTLFGRVVGIEQEGDRQAVMLADGRRVAARLVVVATGLATVLLRRLGFSYRLIRRNHSVAIGFDIALEPGRAMPPPFVQHPTSVRDWIDYLAVFPMGGAVRANLFTYKDIGSPWMREFCRDPDAVLDACMPGLDKLLGPYRVDGPVQTRTNDLRVLDAPVRDGVVVIGDAFQTPCPALGVGIPRLVSDVEALARHAPAWLSTPGMGAEKIAQFYGDAAKVALDARLLRTAEYRRALATEQSARWAFNRAKAALRSRVKRAVIGIAHRRAFGRSIRRAMSSAP